MIDERLIKRNYRKQNKDNEETVQIHSHQLVYTARQLAEAMPGISYRRILELIAEGKIRTIPAGIFSAKWEVIPHNTLMEDLARLVGG